MIVTVSRTKDAKAVERELIARGLWIERFEDRDRVQFAIAPSSQSIDPETLRGIEGVESVTVPKAAHPLVDKMPRVVNVRGKKIGVGEKPILISGPCSVESEAQIRDLAKKLSAAGVSILRGGAFKPRTSPYAFQGHGDVALRWMRRAADECGMAMVTEVMAAEDAPLVAELADIVQIGSRNMHSYSLLKTAAKQKRPMLLKRGMAATIEEWLAAGEYCLVHGAPAVIFCERGIRGFDPSTRNVLDLGAVALLAEAHELPVIVDPSHAAGRRDLIPALSRAALAAGAAGLMVEAHEDPGSALSDGPQALTVAQLSKIAEVM